MSIIAAAALICGCSVDVTLYPEVREAGILGKSYRTSVPFAITELRGRSAITPRTDSDATSSSVDSDVIAAGAKVQIVEVRRNWHIMTGDLYYPVVQHDSGKYLVSHGFVGFRYGGVPHAAAIDFFDSREDLREFDTATLLEQLSVEQPWDTRFAAADALRQARSQDADVIEAILLILHHEEDPDVRLRLVHTLDAQLVAAYPYNVANALIRPDLTPVEHQHLESILIEAGDSTVPAMRTLLRQSGEGDEDALRKITDVLIGIGPPARAALDDLDAAMRRQGDRGIGRLGARLASIDRELAIEHLILALDADSLWTRRYAAMNLARFKHAARSAVPRIEALAAAERDPQWRESLTEIAAAIKDAGRNDPDE